MNSTTNDPNPSPSPLEQQGKKRSHIRIIAFIVGIHVVFLGGILIQGCKPGEGAKTTSTSASAATNDSNLPQENPNYYKSLEPASNVVSNPTNYPTPEAAAASNAIAHATQSVNEPANSVPAQGSSEYEIKSGDSLAKIAKSHGIGLKAIRAANLGVDAARLQIGQKIQIPAPQAVSTEQAVNKDSVPKAADGKPVNGNAGNYAVKSGDSLIKIAKTHGISVQALKSANALKTSRIHAGQKLKIPAAPPKETASAPSTPSTN